ncbi:non-ribosomal peptide synthetase [Burkholderia ubonensis]|uniref:Non-ribosomal peptide synthetase n=1 Tax=Burkholderia ubonensis subsp. mesacidophila TaxID=265293 RepID=A0A2A4FDM2_9BURK|nr:non-ribosomal peptide synthetase [Burkholderia ubonensis]PCE30708.1 non-ribosomal peptide synthetase [Burkholderia ubonensis subsp. mesacidophila]
MTTSASSPHLLPSAADARSAAPAIEAVLPLTPMQHGMLFHSLLDPASAVFFQQLVAGFDGTLDADAFAAAWAGLGERHQSLRTAFLWERHDAPRQVVLRGAQVPLEWLDWSALDDAACDARLDAHLRADRERRFDLAKAPLLRVTLVRRAAARHLMIVSHHHLILDGWSTGVLMDELLALYTARVQRRTAALPAAPRYAAFVERLARADRPRDDAFWRATLAGFEQPTPLVGDVRRDAATSGDYAPCDLRLDAHARRALDNAARRHRVSPATPVFAAWAWLLARRADVPEVVYGITVAGRSATVDDADRLVGLCINTVPLRVPVPAQGDLGGWLRDVQERLARTQPHEHASLSEIQRASGLPAGVPLFDSLVVYENYPVAPAPADAPLRLVHARVEERANYPLTLIAEPRSDGLALRLIVDRTRIAIEEGRRMLDQLRVVLDGIARADERADLAGLALLTADAQRHILHDWNATDVPYDRTATLHGLFARRAAQAPDAPALTDRAGTVSYRELDRLSRAVADALDAAGAPSGAPVAVRMLRDRHLVAALLGVLRSGRAYVPLPRNLPPARVGDMLDTLSIGHIVTSSSISGETADHLDGRRAAVLVAEDVVRTAGADGPREDRGAADDLAYVIFTSGSTGKPKGVMVRHRPAVNLIDWVNRTFAVGPSDRMLFVTSPAFDLSVYDIFGMLAAGGSIRMADDDDVQDPERLARILVDEPVTFWDSAPAALWQLHPLLPERVRGSRLRLVFCSGDWIPLSLPDSMRRSFRGATVVALGGATEATIWSNYHVVGRVEPGWRSIPYGRPIQNARYYILDRRLRPVPPGMPGDLYIGGECLCDGYAGQPALTAERFIADPHCDRPGARMYRTGDRARFWDDGTMEFLGRDDHQVKIRGFRVELGEIEAALARHPDVLDAVAVLRADGGGGPADGPEDRALVAYAVPRPGARAQPADLIAHLRGLLPPPMVPAHLMVLDALPVSANGKVDRRALPAPPAARAQAGAAAHQLEALVAGIWADVLGLTTVPVDQDFFALGGHSLRATSVIARLRVALHRDVPLALLYRHPTVRELSAAIVGRDPRTDGRHDARDGDAALPLLSRDGPLPLSPAQERLWFLHRLEPDSPFYTIVLAAWLNGRVDRAALERAVATVVERHEILRSHIVEVDGRPAQAPVGAGLPLPIRVADLTGSVDPEADAVALARAATLQPFDLARELPFRVLLAQTRADCALALILMDHAAADGWSVGIFAQELLGAYDALVEGAEPALPPLEAQYADLSAWQAARLAGGELERQLDYWRATLAGLPHLNLPTDRPRSPRQRFAGAVVRFRMPAAASLALADLARRESCTLFMVGLAAFLAVLRHRSGQDDLAVGTDLAGRTHPAAERLIGFFVNQLVLRIDLAGCDSFRDVLRAVRRRVLDGFFHQDVPFDTLVRTLNPPREPGRMPLFQVKFVLQNTPFVALSSRHLRVEPLEIDTGTAKYDLLATLAERPDGLAGTLEYATDLFDAATATGIAADLQAVLDLVAQDPAVGAADLARLLNAGEAQRAEVGRQSLRRAGLERLRQLGRARGAAHE